MKLLLASLLVSSTAVAAPATLDDFAGKLAGLSCPTMSTLEPVIGAQHYKPKTDEMANLDPLPVTVANADTLGIHSATAHLAIDYYHQSPSSVKDPMVGELELTLDDKAKLDASKLAGATHYAVDKDTIWHAGALYVGPHRMTMTCGGRVPAWAQQAWTGGDATAATHRILDAFDGKGAAASDERYQLTVDKQISAQFKTPLPAGELLAALGAKKVVIKTVDVHRSHWVLMQADGKPITYKGWQIEFSIDETGVDKTATLDASKLLLTSLNATHP